MGMLFRLDTDLHLCEFLQPSNEEQVCPSDRETERQGERQIERETAIERDSET